MYKRVIAAVILAVDIAAGAFSLPFLTAGEPEPLTFLAPAPLILTLGIFIIQNKDVIPTVSRIVVFAGRALALPLVAAPGKPEPLAFLAPAPTLLTWDIFIILNNDVTPAVGRIMVFSGRTLTFPFIAAHGEPETFAFLAPTPTGLTLRGFSAYGYPESSNRGQTGNFDKMTTLHDYNLWF